MSQVELFSDLYRFYLENQDLGLEKNKWQKMEDESQSIQEKYKNTSFGTLCSSLISAEKEEILDRNDIKRRLFDDVYKYYEKFHDTVDEPSYWEALVSEGNRIGNYYKKIPFIGKMAKNMVLGIIDDIERRYRNEKNQ